MHYLSIDHLVVYFFLLITLIVGFWAGRGVKDIKDYALGNRAFGTVALVLTFLATEVGGQGSINLAGEIGTTGIIVLITFLSFSLSYLVQALWIAPKMVRFPNCMTMGDIMGELYGGPSQVITGIFGFIITICASGAEVLMLGIATQSLLGIDARIGMILGGGLLTFYVVHGGIKAVTTTDVLQFLVLLVLLPVLAATALQQAGGIKSVLTHIPGAQLSLSTHPKFSYYLVLFLSFGVFHFNTTDPALIQRMLMAQSAQQLRQMFLTLAGLFSVIFLVFMLLGTTGHQLYPTLAAADLVPHMIKELLPVGLRGLMMAGIIAVVMASADSYLQTAGLTLVHDVLQPLFAYRAMKVDEIRWVRYATLLAGLLIIGLGLTQGEDLYGLIFSDLEFAIPLLVFPFFAGILGLKPDRRAFYLSAAVTLSTFFVGKIWLPEALSHFLPIICVLASGVTFFTVHFVRNSGFSVVRRGTQDADEHLWQPHRQDLITYLRHTLPTPHRIVQYSQQQVGKYGAPYILFGAFCCVNYTLPYFMWEHGTPVSYDLMLYLRVLGGLACGLLIVRDKWPASLVRYLPTFWHLTLLYCLPFTSTVMFLLTQGSVEWLINVAIIIMFLIVLVDWISFVVLTLLGFAMGFLFYKLAIGPIDLQLDFSTGYLLVYQGIFATLIGLIFARRKQLSFDKLATDNQALVATDLAHRENLLEAFREKVRIIQTLKNAGVQNLLRVAKLIKDLRVQDKNSPPSEVTPHLEATLIPMALQLQDIEHRATDYLRLQVDTFSINVLLEKVKAQLLTQGRHKEMHYRLPTQYEEVECDLVRIITLLMNGITAIQQSTGVQVPILVGIEDTQLQYLLPSVQSGYLKKIAALRITITTRPKLPAIQAAYMAQMNSSLPATPENSQALVLLDNRRIVKAHYGYSGLTEDTQCYVIPVWLREVRPEDMDKPYMELGVAPVRANDHYPGAQAQERAFLTEVSQRTTANIETIKTVIEIIKWYHGPVYRKTGEPFYLHPLAVAQIVLDYDQDEATLLGALLHDTVEDTHILLEHIETVFGKETAAIVDKVTHLECTQDSFYKIKLSAEENILMLLESGDDRAMHVKLADRVHNMRTIEGKSTTSKVRIAKETLQFFVPQAQRLGLLPAAKELQERSMKVLGKTTTR
jgi:Na+/proline symporter